MNFLKTSVVFLAISAFSFFVNAADADSTFNPETVSAEAFMNWARRQPLQENWGKLKGTILSRTLGKTIERPIVLAMRATPKRVFSQLILGDSEIYTVSQAFEAVEGSTSVVANNPTEKKELPIFGVKPEDLSFSFLYWDFTKELDPETIRMIRCRVVELSSPEKDEFTRVWISTTYALPIRVQWFKKGTETYYRSLEIDDVVKLENQLWIVSSLSLAGKGWRTKIDFPERAAGKVAEGVPTDLFKVQP